VSASAPTVFLVLEEGIDPRPIEEALPPGTRVQPTNLKGDRRAVPLEGASDAALVIVGCVQHSESALELIEATTRQLTARPPIVVLYGGSPNGFMERAFQVGADDLITLPQPREQLAFALEKAIARRRNGSAVPQAGTMIVVLGPKGGTGKTLTACNLAEALARAGRSPVVVDLDLQFGDVGLALGLTPDKTIYDLAVAGGSLDGEKIDSYLAVHESGARVLLAPLRPDQAAAVSTGLLRTVFETLRARYEFVIVDTPPAFTPDVIAAIDSASDLCMVGMLDALSLKDTKIGLETLSQMGYDPFSVTLVLNRADTNVGIGKGDIEKLLGRRPDVLVPSDRSIPRAITEGQTIVAAEPRSGAARAFEALAQRYVDARNGAGSDPDASEASGRRRGILLRKGAR
jgi:pilus assembly protein CpaE